MMSSTICEDKRITSKTYVTLRKEDWKGLNGCIFFPSERLCLKPTPNTRECFSKCNLSQDLYICWQTIYLQISIDAGYSEKQIKTCQRYFSTYNSIYFLYIYQWYNGQISHNLQWNVWI